MSDLVVPVPTCVLSGLSSANVVTASLLRLTTLYGVSVSPMSKISGSLGSLQLGMILLQQRKLYMCFLEAKLVKTSGFYGVSVHQSNFKHSVPYSVVEEASSSRLPLILPISLLSPGRLEGWHGVAGRAGNLTSTT